MKNNLVRIGHETNSFAEVPMYDLSITTQTCICKFELHNKVVYRLIDIPTGCPYGKTFFTLKEARTYRSSTKHIIEDMSKLEEVRCKSAYYNRLVTERSDYIRRMSK